MDLGLRDWVYLVTGGSRGLGFGALLSVGGSPPGTIAATTDDAWRSAFESVFLGAAGWPGCSPPNWAAPATAGRWAAP